MHTDVGEEFANTAVADMLMEDMKSSSEDEAHGPAIIDHEDFSLLEAADRRQLFWVERRRIGIKCFYFHGERTRMRGFKASPRGKWEREELL